MTLFDLPGPKDNFLGAELALLSQTVASVARRMEDDALTAEVIRVLRGKGYTVTPPGEARPPSPAELAVKRVEALCAEWAQSPYSVTAAYALRAALASPALAPQGEEAGQ